jgi:hypothetical protein
MDASLIFVSQNLTRTVLSSSQADGPVDTWVAGVCFMQKEPFRHAINSTVSASPLAMSKDPYLAQSGSFEQEVINSPLASPLTMSWPTNPLA